MKSKLLLAILTTSLSACATTSFAPPRVNTQSKVTERPGIACATSVATGTDTVINPDVAGATQLVNNFVLAYRCAERELANGRQGFQVPAFLAAVAGLAGPSFGVSNDAILASGVGAGILNSGNSYYAPRAKAGVVGAALRSVLCVKTEAAGVSYFKHSRDPETNARLVEGNTRALNEQLRALVAQRAQLDADLARGSNVQSMIDENAARQHAIIGQQVSMALANSSSSGTVTTTAQQQYFEMVSGALFSIESILAERLRDAGSIDTTDTFARLKELVKQHADAEKALEEQRQTEKDAKGFVALTSDMVELENKVLHPRLQTCVLQARD